ncbi:hypothetical protein [Nocardia sp. 348MFTsu5.1]|uniref:hypothetical protein n=1 Tax=Nocardia sp. 348MFTsu5.1 TaxID=1172185 RepID=UPI0003A59E51|nr:hypothetical protein [Nocardia sp. 348MFTsu5.1]
MGDFTEDSDGLVWRSVAVARGHSDEELRRAVRAGHLHRIWPGAYVLTAHRHPRDDLAHLRLTAAARSCDGIMPVSHVSAALLHNLPLLKPSHEKVHFTNGRASGGRIESRRHIHAGLLLPRDVTAVNGIAVTTIERTAVDTAQTGTFEQGLAVFDSALRLGADRDLMTSMVAGRRGRQRIAHARLALTSADRLSETVGESWSRAQMIACPDIPRPRLQHVFYSADGRFIARVDFDWDGRLVGEFDGLVKYGGGLMKAGQTPNDVVIAEKIREDRLRQMGIEIVRWTWADLVNGNLPTILRRAMVRTGIM